MYLSSIQNCNTKSVADANDSERRFFAGLTLIPSVHCIRSAALHGKKHSMSIDLIDYSKITSFRFPSVQMLTAIRLEVREMKLVVSI